MTTLQRARKALAILKDINRKLNEMDLRLEKASQVKEKQAA
ncbi:MAG: hypothetical protein OEX12_15780 [Gammaproteobacteria bacterium]|nr:hypothetical protein [Gammaproteobacteria bacterium]